MFSLSDFAIWLVLFLVIRIYSWLPFPVLWLYFSVLVFYLVQQNHYFRIHTQRAFLPVGSKALSLNPRIHSWRSLFFTTDLILSMPIHACNLDSFSRFTCVPNFLSYLVDEFKYYWFTSCSFIGGLFVPTWVAFLLFLIVSFALHVF